MERLVPRHGPLKQISNKMPSCIVLIKWLLVLEKVIVSYQRNDSTHFHVRKHVFASVTYRVWVTQRQLHNEKSLLAWVMTHMRSIPGSSPIIYRQLCASSTAYYCVVLDKVAVQLVYCSATHPRLLSYTSESCVDPSSSQEALFQFRTDGCMALAFM